MYVVLSVILLLVFLVMGVPVAFSFTAATVFLMVTLGYSPAFLMPYGYSKLVNPVLLCIPLFIIAGSIIRRGKLGDALISFVEQFVGRFRSGLGSVTVVTCAIFGAISGSAGATLSCVGSIMAPKLCERGYSRGVAGSLIASSAVLALLIPPSAAQVLFAWSAGQSVLACFLSTVIPGIILVILFCIIQHFQLLNDLKNKPANVVIKEPSTEKMTWKSFTKNTGFALPALVMPVIILGGIYSGIMTPAESAAVAALYCLPVALYVYKAMRWKHIGKVMAEAGRSTGSIFLMLVSTMFFGRILVMEKVPEMLLGLFTSISDNKYVVITMLNVIMIIVGMLMDDSSGIVLCAPLLLPVAQGVGFSPIHFAAILGVNLGMGLVTPPMAGNLYFASQVCDAPVGEMLKPCLQLIAFGWLPTLILTTVIPEISLFLPNLILG